MAIPKLFFLIFITSFYGVYGEIEPIGQNDIRNILNILDNTLVTKKDQIEYVFFALGGYNSLIQGDKFKHSFTEICSLANNVLTSEKSKLSDLYYATATLNYLSNMNKPCKVIGTENAKQASEKIISSSSISEPQHLLHAIKILSNLGLNIDLIKSYKHVKSLIEKDPSAYTQCVIFQIVPFLKLSKAQLKVHFDEIDDVIQQGDETSEYFYYENGVITTSQVIVGITDLLKSYGEVIKFDASKIMKLTDFLLSQRYSKDPKVLFNILKALQIIGSNNYISPVSVNLLPNLMGGLEPKAESLIITVTDIFSNNVDLNSLTVTPKSLKQINSNSNNINIGIKSVALKIENNHFVQPLATLLASGETLIPGLYELSFSGVLGKKSKKNYIGIETFTIKFKVTDNINVKGAKIFIEDREDNSHSHKVSIDSVGHQHKEKELSVLSHQNLIVTVYLPKKSPKSVAPHQMFLSLRKEGSSSINEIVFVAQIAKNSKSEFDEIVANIDLTKSANDFGYQSGVYSIFFIVGDKLFKEGGLQWNLGRVTLNFPSAPLPNPAVGSPKVHFADAPKLVGDSKPEIGHTFRTPEKRAPSVIVFTFVILCVAPFGLMLAIWLGMGVNVKGMLETHVYGLLFHVFLSAIFGIYFMYWLRWNMFITMKYLCLAVVPTFLLGHKMLWHIAATREINIKKKSG